ncbi:type II toxin-antitoxin system RelE/ParE family toxin [Thalassomonas actiniarum]|uniref:Type II toxin-antitoxin system RelE/ParE family toxin n=1 Tax=Thalassomonas actiniarum TaxID=485447 RepID=A0AAE9YKW4_9GAMM|nr:type II toxin-antitoxin system RelE/ParE family toxin [Thalassomonas actiniarum]WDD97167.1 type II toxin-antitoxin system RelE/ParE family toxin [Thalassomonas actiniarum]
MSDYLLSCNAKEDLKRIYAYGVAEFGEKKAESYFYAFFDKFEQIASSPYLYQTVDHIRPGYRRCVCGRDSIYYRVINNTTEIMAVIGEQETDLWL